MSFDPSELRDDHGRWTAGGAANVAMQEDNDHAEGVRRFAAAATNVAVDLGFDPSKITVTDDEKKFELNGKTYDYAGAAYLSGPDKGKVLLYEKQLSPRSVFEVTAHEIGHQKFQKFLDDYKAESDAVAKEPGPPPDPNAESYPQRRGGSFAVMSGDGSLREPYASKYPLYSQYHNLVDKIGTDQFAKSDGITPYSEEWWKAWKDGKAGTDQAFHETIAEMTARRYVRGPSYDELSPKFKDAGYSLDMSSSGGKETYSVRKWKGTKVIDPKDLPQSLRGDLEKLNSPHISEGMAALKYNKTPAPEWVALYDAINDHWNKTA